MNIKSEKVKLEVKGEAGAMHAYIASPESGGPYPAVLVIEEIFGINAHIRDVTDRVAREGYVAIAPDVHHRAMPAGWELAYDADGMKKGMEVIPKLTAHGIAADLAAVTAFLRARNDVRGDRIGIMGFCIGGHVAYLAACTTDVRAAASFYGGGVAVFSPGGGPPTVTRSSGIKGKILCLFGANDSMIPPSQIETIKSELEKHKIRHDLVVYPSAAHAFFRDVDPTKYVKAAADDAWSRVKKLFAEELG
jgi:carboxymethylenebutenolidase